jgi:hypothetical protein
MKESMVSVGAGGGTGIGTEGGGGGGGQLGGDKVAVFRGLEYWCLLNASILRLCPGRREVGTKSGAAKLKWDSNVEWASHCDGLYLDWSRCERRSERESG